LKMPGETGMTHRTGDDGIVHVVIDGPGGSVNLLTRDTLEYLEKLVDEVNALQEARGVLFRSARPGIFLAGLHFDEITAFREAFRVAEAARYGQEVFSKIERLAVPTACAIGGSCLGPGAELALACDYRVASDDPAVRIGMPETRLGIIPSFGGTQRLPRLVGMRAAIDMIAMARRLNARQALAIGLVDMVAPAPYLERESLELLNRAAEDPRGTLSAYRRGRNSGARLLERIGPFRKLLMTRYRRSLSQVVDPSRYPASFRALDAVEAAFSMPESQGFDLEARMAGELVPSITARNLIWLFRTRNAVRRGAPGVRALPRSIGKVGVLGAGVIGGGISLLLADREIPVRLTDVNGEAVRSALRTAHRALEKKAGASRVARRQVPWKIGYISTASDFSGMTQADLVIEAVDEDLELKRKVLAAVEARLGERAVYATTTSCLTVEKIAAAAERPERVVGLHFFSPVDRMQLVEVVTGPGSSPEAVATARDLALRLGKTPVSIKDSPGFLVGRILMFYLAESLRLLAEGVRIEAVDGAMRGFGLPTGPFALIDRLGIDKVQRMAEILAGEFEDRFDESAIALATMASAGRHGLRKGSGFYRYRDGRSSIPDREAYNLLGARQLRDIPLETVQERLVLTMVNEAAACLKDEVVRGPAEIDLAMVLGLGFPAFRGGLMRHADTVGIPIVVDRLDRLADSHGERHRPAGLLGDMVRSLQRFYEP